jgi:RHS repeat-associated protein
MTDKARTVVWKANYKPFGEEQETGGIVQNDRRFVGKEKDEETGLYYFGARYMGEKIGRFISPDPVGTVDARNGKINGPTLLNPQRMNYYAYGLNNPNRYGDSLGRWAEDVHSGIGNPDYGTFKWAREVGFSHNDAKRIAIADNGTDGGFSGWLPIIGDQSRHFDQRNLLRNGVDSRDYWARVEFERAVESYKAGKLDEALGHLGKGLHSIQDKYAHRGWNTGVGGTIRHPAWFDDWHDPRNKDAAEATEKASKDYLRRFGEAIE